MIKYVLPYTNVIYTGINKHLDSPTLKRVDEILSERTTIPRQDFYIPIRFLIPPKELIKDL